MEMRLCWPGEAFTSQGRSASGAKAPPRLPGRRIELAYLPIGNRIRLEVIKSEDGNRCTCMPSTTLTMTPIYRLGLSGRDKTDRTAEAATFKLLGRTAHDLISLVLESLTSTLSKLSRSQCRARCSSRVHMVVKPGSSGSPTVRSRTDSLSNA